MSDKEKFENSHSEEEIEKTEFESEAESFDEAVEDVRDNNESTEDMINQNESDVFEEENDDIFGFDEEDEEVQEQGSRYKVKNKSFSFFDFVMSGYERKPGKFVRNAIGIGIIALLFILVCTDVIPILPNSYHRSYVGNKYTIGETKNCTYDKLGDNVLYIGSGSLCVFGPDMDLKYRKDVHTGIPKVKVNCESAIAFFKNTGEYVLVNDSKAEQRSIEEKIKSVSVNKDGYYAIVTDAVAGHNACVSAYSPDGKSIYEWFTNFNVIDTAISPGGTHLAVSVLEVKDGALAGKLIFFDLSESSAVAEIDFGDIFLFELYSTKNGRVIGFGEDRTVAYTFDGKKIWENVYEEKTFKTYDICEDGKIACVFDRYDSGESESLLEIYNFDGKFISSYTADNSIRSLSFNNDHCLLTLDDSVVLLNKKCRVKKEKSANMNFNKIILYENYNFGFVVHDGVSEVVSVKH